jgi:hypothetical protein
MLTTTKQQIETGTGEGGELLLGHELCGHAVPSDYSDMGAIKVKNDIHVEHDVPGIRDGSDHVLPKTILGLPVAGTTFK